MICSFCGTENRDGNKFCGICGVRLERRRTERRVRNEGAHLSCASCGHVNDQGYKFCGMCGTRIDRRMAERRGAADTVRAEHAHTVTVPISVPEVPRNRTTQAEATFSRNTATVVAPHAPANVRAQSEEKPLGDHHDVGGIRGPSFLGLSDDSEDEGGYLLEEEGRSHGGWRLLVLLLVLAAIAGLVFLQYRSSLNAKPAAHPTAPAPQGQNQFEPAAQPEPNQQPSPAGTAPLQQKSQPSTNAGPNVTSSDPPNGIDPQPHVTPAKADTSLTEALDPADDVDKTADLSEKAEAAKAAGKAVVEVPSEQKPSSTLLRAQQFLQGKGVEQNCEQGLVYLRAAAQKNEPAAAVQMGALYASGRCVKQDRVMAYRWFNSAHELQPANQWIQKNMDQLWGQMSEQERRLAGY